MLTEDLIERYLACCVKERRLSDKTVRAYRTDLFQYLAWMGERGDDQGGTSGENIRAYIVHLNGRYAPASVKRKLASLRALMSFASEEGVIPASPFDGLTIKIRESKRLPRTVPLSQMERLFRHMNGVGEGRPAGSRFQAVRDRAIPELPIATGIRVFELCALDLGSVDIDGRTVRIWGKGSKERVVQMEDDRTIEAVAEYLGIVSRKLV